MNFAVEITRPDHTAAKLHGLAAKSNDADKTRRLLALAMIRDGLSRLDTARQACVGSSDAGRLGSSCT
jgi:hypothetical protein